MRGGRVRGGRERWEERCEREVGDRGEREVGEV